MEDLTEKLTILGLGVLAWVVVTVIIVAVSDLGSGRAKERWQIALFLGPTMLLLAMGLIIPAIRTFILSFLNGSSDAFVGLDNYAWMFTQPEAVRTIINTAVWVLVAPIAATAVGLLYAILIDKTRGEAVAKTFVFLPMAISFVGAGIIWRFMYAFRPEGAEQIGVVNAVITLFGGRPTQLLNNDPLNTFLLILVLIWVQAGFAMVILSAAIKGVPDEIIEAARLDGVNAWQQFTNVTLPSIRPSLIVVLSTITITTLKVFDIVRTMTGGNFNTSVVANEFYTQAFTRGQFGYGSALAVFLFVLVIPLVIYQVRQLRIRQEIG